MTQMKRAFILIGASGSGKSTVRKKLKETYGESLKAFSLDDCRINFYLDTHPGYGTTGEGLTEGDMYSKAFAHANKNGKEFDAYVAMAWRAARQATVVVVDNVNGTRKSRAPWVTDLRKDKFHITMVQVQTPLNVILERQLTRKDKSVPADVVRSMYMRQEEAMVGSECDSILVIDGTKEWRP